MAPWLMLAAAAGSSRFGIFEAGTFSPLVALAIFAVLVYGMIQMARAGVRMRQIHPLAGLDALDEAIGRATEMGRPVVFVPGISGATDPATLAAFPILAHTATTAARYDTRIMALHRDPVVYAISETIVRESFLEAGRPDAYNPDDIRFITDDQFGFTGGVFQVIADERPAACVFYGDFGAEAMLLAEVAAMAGAVQITATTNTIQMPFFMAASDYLLIGEEMYAASAYISKDPVLVGTIVGEDLYKFLMFALLVVGIVVASVLHGDTRAFASFLKL